MTSVRHAILASRSSISRHLETSITGRWRRASSFSFSFSSSSSSSSSSEATSATLGWMRPASTRYGISAASHGASPSASAWAIPKCGTLRAHSGWKCSVRQMTPPVYIFGVSPSSSGSATGTDVCGYVTGTSNWRSSSYLTRS
eukprot:Amastigsp_a174400_653.p3 type:complete len:143 gc:universal Amastigsp_a174400_653:249-677(+)